MNIRRTRKSRFLSLFAFCRGVEGSLVIWGFFYIYFFYIYLINFQLDGDVPIEIREIRIKKGTENLMRGGENRASEWLWVTVSPKKKPVERKKKKGSY